MEELLSGRYRLLEVIGSGGMAVVYRAEDIRTGKPVAVKFLKQELEEDDEFAMRFQREAEAVSRMSHHNVVNLLDVGYENERHYLVMEYVQGQTLKDLIRKKGRMKPTLAAQITLRILAALNHAHANGVIHRDIKPQNILVHADGHIKVADFGIATRMNSETLSRADNVIGSVHYISPEQASGKEIGITSDIYSVGVVLFEMMTGRVPYDGDTIVSVAMQHLRRETPSVRSLAPHVTPGLAYVVSKAMEKDPGKRYQSAQQMGIDLQAALTGELDKTLREEEAKDAEAALPQPVKPKRKPMRPAVRYFLIACLSLAVIAALAFGSYGVYNAVVNSASAPDLTGMELTAAIRAAQRERIQTRLIYVNHPTVTADFVIMQAPEYATPMRRGDTMVLTVSSGPSLFVVPEITNKLIADAVAELQRIGLVLTVTERVVSMEPIDTVLEQFPEPGVICAQGDKVQVTVSGGYVLMPELTGLSFEEAEATINLLGLMPGVMESLNTTDPERVGIIA
ncbi:MAG: protein kinase, partial [Clostridia bacterium]|nr:protein kinase [Clostridia bacterium]